LIEDFLLSNGGVTAAEDNGHAFTTLLSVGAYTLYG